MKKKTLLIIISVILLGGVTGTVYAVGASPEPPKPPVVIQRIPGPEIPQLTKAEEIKVKQIVFSDARVRELIGERKYAINSVGVWLSSRPELQKIGGFVEITFEKPFFADRDWPAVRDDKEKYGTSYIEGTVPEALWVKKLNIRVDLRKGEVVGITPLPFG